jgi:serine protease AprX
MDREEVFKLIYGAPTSGRRFTQDSPVLPDVWLEYALDPREAKDLLLTPYTYGGVRTAPGELAKVVRERLEADRAPRGAHKPTGKGTAMQAGPALGIGTSFNQSTVVARMTFREMCRCVLPLSKWWTDRVCGGAAVDLGSVLRRKKHDIAERLEDFWSYRGRLPAQHELLWLVQIVGSVALEEERGRRGGANGSSAGRLDAKGTRGREARGGEEAAGPPHDSAAIVEHAAEVFDGATTAGRAYVYSVSLNRPLKLSVSPPPPAPSVKAIKADAARRLFALNCNDLAWAIIDSGVDATHPCFRKRNPAKKNQLYEHPFVRDDQAKAWENCTRVVETYDFSLVRRIVSDDEEDFNKLPARVRDALKGNEGARIKKHLQSGNELDWSLLAPLIRIPHDRNYRNDKDPDRDHVPVSDHGTHVAGLLAADWQFDDRPVSLRPDPSPARQPHESRPGPPAEGLVGVCPDINLYDLRVLSKEGEGDEFTVMAALQFVRYLNAHLDYATIHGVNLSLSIPHEVANYACGRTPVCEECERVVAGGTVVVSAAGNDGYLHYRTEKGQYEGYQTVSITDPGNADGVITVGSTHREAPHTYGVSYFSSRGPTGDGRNKPDLVAPGEKINGPTPNAGSRWLDGTSMAAPHVSGAAALVMARHRELAGRPARVKQVLCEAATDLGRERYFQGAGMLDVLRALQSV